MKRDIILTLTGPDRIGIVREVTGLLLAHGANVEISRMVRLGGEFAVLMQVALPQGITAELDSDLSVLIAQGYKVSTSELNRPETKAPEGWKSFRIEVQGTDHEGIIHEVSEYLSGLGANIESISSETTPAPTTGSPLFAMTALVVVPPDLAIPDWKAGFDAIGSKLNVEIDVFETGNA